MGRRRPRKPWLGGPGAPSPPRRRGTAAAARRRGTAAAERRRGRRAATAAGAGAGAAACSVGPRRRRRLGRLLRRGPAAAAATTAGRQRRAAGRAAPRARRTGQQRTASYATPPPGSPAGRGAARQYGEPAPPGYGANTAAARQQRPTTRRRRCSRRSSRIHWAASAPQQQPTAAVAGTTAAAAAAVSAAVAGSTGAGAAAVAATAAAAAVASTAGTARMARAGAAAGTVAGGSRRPVAGARRGTPRGRRKRPNAPWPAPVWPAGAVSWPPGAPPPRGYPGPPPPRPSPLGELPPCSQLCPRGTKCRSSVCVFFHADGSIGSASRGGGRSGPRRAARAAGADARGLRPRLPGPAARRRRSAHMRRRVARRHEPRAAHAEGPRRRRPAASRLPRQRREEKTEREPRRPEEATKNERDGHFGAAFAGPIRRTLGCAAGAGDAQRPATPAAARWRSAADFMDGRQSRATRPPRSRRPVAAPAPAPEPAPAAAPAPGADSSDLRPVVGMPRIPAGMPAEMAAAISGGDLHERAQSPPFPRRWAASTNVARACARALVASFTRAGGSTSPKNAPARRSARSACEGATHASEHAFGARMVRERDVAVSRPPGLRRAARLGARSRVGDARTHRHVAQRRRNVASHRGRGGRRRRALAPSPVHTSAPRRALRTHRAAGRAALTAHVVERRAQEHLHSRATRLTASPSRPYRPTMTVPGSPRCEPTIVTTSPPAVEALCASALSTRWTMGRAYAKVAAAVRLTRRVDWQRRFSRSRRDRCSSAWTPSSTPRAATRRHVDGVVVAHRPKPDAVSHAALGVPAAAVADTRLRHAARTEVVAEDAQLVVALGTRRRLVARQSPRRAYRRRRDLTRHDADDVDRLALDAQRPAQPDASPAAVVQRASLNSTLTRHAARYASACPTPPPSSAPRWRWAAEAVDGAEALADHDESYGAARVGSSSRAPPSLRAPRGARRRGRAATRLRAPRVARPPSRRAFRARGRTRGCHQIVVRPRSDHGRRTARARCRSSAWRAPTRRRPECRASSRSSRRARRARGWSSNFAHASKRRRGCVVGAGMRPRGRSAARTTSAKHVHRAACASAPRPRAVAHDAHAPSDGATMGSGLAAAVPLHGEEGACAEVRASRERWSFVGRRQVRRDARDGRRGVRANLWAQARRRRARRPPMETRTGSSSAVRRGFRAASCWST